MADFNLRAVITAKDEASKEIGNLNKSLNTLAKVGIAGAVAGVAGLTAAAISTVKSFEESENVIAQTNAVLKSTNGAAKLSAVEIGNLASSLEGVTRFSDETIQSGENMLLTFTSIGRDVFPQATETMLNMSQALGQDVKNSAIQLGKALNDPIQGVTALRRVGVQFNDEQQKIIEKLVKSGDLMGAQKLILKELETEFGNSAKAAGETFAGKMDILKNKFDNIKETIGGTIVAAITPFVTMLSDWASKTDVQDKIREMINTADAWVTEVAIPWITQHWPEIKRIATETFNAITGTLKALIDFAKSPEGKITLGILGVGYVMSEILKVGVTLLDIIDDNPYVVSLVIALWGFKEARDEMNRVGDKARETEGPWQVKLDTALAWDSARSLLDNIYSIFKGVILGPVSLGMKLGGALEGAFRAEGGPVMGGRPYIVGERGPELFVPSSSGQVIPNNQITNNSPVINFYGNITNTSNASLDAIGQRIARSFQLAQQGI